MADETLDVELTEAVKDVFYPALRDKLIKLLGESDSTLFEYIVLLISNKRTKSHIVNDLQAFFQDSAKDFTQWLWEFLKPFEKKEGTSVMQALAESEEEPERDTEKTKEDRRPRKERTDRDRRRSTSPKRAKSGAHNPGASRLFGNALKTSEHREGRRKRDLREPVQEQEEDPREETKELGGIKISKVVVKKRRSRSPDGEEGEEPDTRDRPRTRDAKRGEKRAGVRVTEGKTEKKSSKVSPHFTITLDGGPPKTKLAELDEDDEYMMGGGTRGIVISGAPMIKPPTLGEIMPVDGLQALVAEPPSGLDRVRCRFWPKCTNANCPYHHPKEICPFYPNCKFGNSCINIHVVGGRGGRGTQRARPPRGRGGFRGRGRGAATGSGFTGQPDEERPVGSEVNEEDEEEVASRVGRGGRGGRGRGGRGRGAANSSKVYDASGVVCRFDTFCEAIRCPYSHPQREINEQHFMAAAEKKTPTAAAAAAAPADTPSAAPAAPAASGPNDDDI